MIERDLLGWDLDNVLEGYDVDFTVDVCEVRLDREEQEKLDRAQAFRDVVDALPPAPDESREFATFVYEGES